MTHVPAPRFLETMVKRLTSELARKQAAADPRTLDVETEVSVSGR